MIRAGKHSMDAAVGRMAKRMREDGKTVVDLCKGEGESKGSNKILKGNHTNMYMSSHTYLHSKHTGASFGKAKVLAAALQPLANALSAHSVSRIVINIKIISM